MIPYSELDTQGTCFDAYTGFLDISADYLLHPDKAPKKIGMLIKHIYSDPHLAGFLLKTADKDNARMHLVPEPILRQDNKYVFARATSVSPLSEGMPVYLDKKI